MVGDRAAPATARAEGTRGDATPTPGGWWPLAGRVQVAALLVGLLAPPLGALAVLSGPSRLQFLALIGPSLLPAAIWAVGSLPFRAGPRGATAGLLVAWSWLAESAYLNRYRPSWPLSEYDPVILDLPILITVCAVVIGQPAARGPRRWRRRRGVEATEASPALPATGSRPRAASLAGLLALATAWLPLALMVAAFVETPPDDVGSVLGLPAGDLLVATGPDSWACSAAGEFCNASAGVASIDGVDSGQVQARLERHLQARGWQHPDDQQVAKGLLWRVPMHVEIRRATSAAVTVIVFWRAEPDGL